MISTRIPGPFTAWLAFWIVFAAVVSARPAPVATMLPAAPALPKAGLPTLGGFS
ncbi:MAG TPA: hypothetical protein VMS88_01195 [Terriglobales bacterium]|nr:hypothetical protein [Terriglobales bacterium]